MTPDVAAFLRNMLAQQTISAGSPELMEVAALTAKTLTQLDQIIEDSAHG